MRSLRHLRTNKKIRIPNRSSVYIGKPNSERPPDINLDHFVRSEIVSHIHAKVKLKSGIWWIKDLFSRRGTYVNDLRLQPGCYKVLHRGDRVSFGGDDMTFIFES